MNTSTRFTLFFGLVLVFVTAKAQDADTSYWAAGGVNTFTFSQVTLKNWAAGGQPSVAINGATGLFANYAKDRQTWETSLDMGYGLIRQGNRDDADFIKSDDKINFVTKYGFKMDKDNKNWFFSALLDFRTQFTDGFAAEDPDSVISRFMAPGYLVLGLGVDYKPAENLSFNYIPVTGKFTFVNDQALADLGAYGVDPGSRTRAELGSYLRIKYATEILPNVMLDSRLELFANYLEDFGNIDVNLQNGVVMKVNKFLTANIFTHLIYDDDIKVDVDRDGDGEVDGQGPRLQFKNVFGVGIAYNFGNIKKE